jgi:hypothetical protein
MSGPRDVHAAQVRILLGELEPLVTKVAEIAGAMDTTSAGLKTQLDELTGKIEKAMDDGAARSASHMKMSFKSMMADERKELNATGVRAAELIDDKLQSRVLKLGALNTALERKGGMFLMLTAVFSMVGGAVGGAVAARLLSGA